MGKSRLLDLGILRGFYYVILGVRCRNQYSTFVDIWRRVGLRVQQIFVSQRNQIYLYFILIRLLSWDTADVMYKRQVGKMPISRSICGSVEFVCLFSSMARIRIMATLLYEQSVIHWGLRGTSLKSRRISPIKVGLSTPVFHFVQIYTYTRTCLGIIVYIYPRSSIPSEKFGSRRWTHYSCKALTVEFRLGPVPRSDGKSHRTFSNVFFLSCTGWGRGGDRRTCWPRFLLVCYLAYTRNHYHSTVND